ncbi:MAG: diphthamide biosynthesis enzyme Dph2 [Candidatus Ranarchaeia archaeon]
MYDFELSKIIKEINEKGASKILFQFPEGLKSYAVGIIDEVQYKVDVECIISGDPCYGGCDVSLNEAKLLDCDLVVHFGHTKFPFNSEIEIPVCYIPVRENHNIKEFIQLIKEEIPKGTKIGLATTVQFTHLITEIKTELEGDFEVKVGTGCEKTPEMGQVLGCDVCNCEAIQSEVELFVFFGSGLFHPIAIGLFTDKPVYALNPHQKTITNIDKEIKKFLAIRVANIEKMKQTKKIGVIVGLKIGQNHFRLAENLLKLIKENNKEGYLIAMNSINPDVLINFQDIDGYVITACPRLVLDDGPNYNKPTITQEELEIIFGRRTYGSVYPSLNTTTPKR